ncbi:ADP-ribosyl cyclase/cyclic ADP-ribose hydrolase 1-like isoform 1-T1 [Synchiropus picturatus]
MQLIITRQMERRWIICIIASAVIVVALGLGLGLGLSDTSLRTSFINTCQKFSGYDCETAWQEFEKAYVGKDSCSVPPEAYSDLMTAAPFKPNCNNMMLWSKTKDIVSDLTDRRKCFTRLESTMLGAALDNKVWCGREGSKETFTESCPKWDQCVDNPQRSFWTKASASFAESACGNVTVMLDGSRKEPFDPASTFGSVELPKLKAPAVKFLTVVLVMNSNPESTCSSTSLQTLKNSLDPGVRFDCNEVQRSRISQCASDTSIACDKCW